VVLSGGVGLREGQRAREVLLEVVAWPRNYRKRLSTVSSSRTEKR
jgi:hypothetical protein